jgi:hypothetical protein
MSGHEWWLKDCSEQRPEDVREVSNLSHGREYSRWRNPPAGARWLRHSPETRRVEGQDTATHLLEERTLCSPCPGSDGL